MFQPSFVFSGFSVDDLKKAEEFYSRTLGLDTTTDDMGLQLHLPGGGQVYVYSKENHQPATYTMLNLGVENIDDAVKALGDNGVTFERYPDMHQDEKGIARGIAANMGPDIAWFKDPAGNILSVLQNAPKS